MKQSAETILVFDNYTDELECSLKEQERSDTAGSTATLWSLICEISQEMPHGKNSQDYLSNTEDKSQLLKSSPNILHKKTHEKI